MESKIECIELHTKRITIIEASAWTRGGKQNKPQKKARVILKQYNKTYSINSHKIIWAILRQMDADLTWREYTEVTNVPEYLLKTILEDYFSAFDAAIVVWAKEGVIMEVSVMDKVWLEGNEQAIDGLQGYLEWKLDRPLNRYFVFQNVGVALRINTHGADWNGLAGFIEIIFTDSNIKVRGRYVEGDGFIQTIAPVIFKGTLATLDAEKLYGHLDRVWASLNNYHRMRNHWVLDQIVRRPNWDINDKTHFNMVKNTLNMLPKEQDALERAWFATILTNTFIV